MEHKTIIDHTNKWIKSVVIDLNLCPFAAKALLKKSIRYHVADHAETEKALEFLQHELHLLDNDEEIETSFIIFPNNFKHFDEYLNLVNKSEQMIQILSYEGVYQIASFHPEYLFEGAKDDDAANYTNRSPYPMLHILREASIEKALRTYKDPEGIPERNMANTRQKGLKYMQALKAACFG